MKNENNFCVIMSGGIGSRLWPYSTESKPKQFLDVLGTGRTLLQMTFDRFSRFMPIKNIFVVTNVSYINIVREQLPEISTNQILLEPIRRGTASCIAYAAYHIQTINPKANMVVAPSDHLIIRENEFEKAIDAGLNFVSAHNVLLTLGITPNRPETGYGYIQMADEKLCEGMIRVKTFIEKPDLELAKIFCESGEFFWNSGVFIWNIPTIMDALHVHLPLITTYMDKGLDLFGTANENNFIQKYFPVCPNISIDYGIMEKASNVYMLPATFGWADMGTWGSLAENSPKDENANVTLMSKVLYFESNDNIVTLPAGKVAVIQGMNDYIIADTKDVLMICKKDEEQRINQYTSALKLEVTDKDIY